MAMNLVPKEGGNRLSVSGVNLYSDSNFSSRATCGPGPT
jgi:hypothetical protein